MLAIPQKVFNKKEDGDTPSIISKNLNAPLIGALIAIEGTILIKYNYIYFK